MPSYQPPKKRANADALQQKLGQRGQGKGSPKGQYNATHQHGELIAKLQSAVKGGQASNLGPIPKNVEKGAGVASLRAAFRGGTPVDSLSADKPTTPRLGASTASKTPIPAQVVSNAPPVPGPGAQLGGRVGGPYFPGKPRKRKPGVTTSAYPR
jgi:hypothetical protein